MPADPSTVLCCLDHYLSQWPKLRRVIVATSGGPDSQALLDALARAAPYHNITAQAVGIDHGLRHEAMAELAHAHALAKRHGLTFVSHKVSLSGRGNLMARARKARYKALHVAAKAYGAHAILLGHTMDDQAETVLFRLARGAGPQGAAGMRAHYGMVHRPLLKVTRREVLSHLQHHDIAFASDPTNHQLARSRARIRHVTLPTLTPINAQAVRHIAHFAQACRDDNDLLQRVAHKWLKRAARGPRALCLAELASAPKALWARVLQQWLHPLGGRPDHAALARLLQLVPPMRQGLQQGAIKGCTLTLEGVILRATPTCELPPRRAGTKARDR